ncbi:hypothetical protein [Parasulfitobacter algicola]|uniref:Uncharacterized protein n=1 Tax=Parasulfitobacter algicola TaxID=2614809 RepID=A0ABX2J199_9RHOB|nr:hypothetical protein [Sulfitobacter algicola]NSX56994.1 hypothetical protein [Sulfitobacter algicola]
MFFTGLMGTLHGPADFDAIVLTPPGDTIYSNQTSGNNHITVFADLQFEHQTLVAPAMNVKTGAQTNIQFQDTSGHVVQSCVVNFVTFDPSIHDFSKTRVGFCEFVNQSGVLDLELGTTTTYDLPEDYYEGATSPRSILDHRPERGALHTLRVNPSFSCISVRDCFAG